MTLRQMPLPCQRCRHGRVSDTQLKEFGYEGFRDPRKGFRFIAIEGDWPDAARVDHYVRHYESTVRMDGVRAISYLDVAK